MDVSRSTLFGDTPIWKTTSGLDRSSGFSSSSGAPYCSRALQTRLAFSLRVGQRGQHLDEVAVHRGGPP
jgi:hypothetical protein